MDHGGPNLQELSAAILNNYLIIFVGFVISTTLYGVTLVQGFFYFRNCAHNAWYIRVLTGVILILDSLTTILPTHAIYYYLIKNFGNFIAGLTEPLTYRVENLILTLITVLVQSFYTHQIWKLSRNKSLTTLLAIITVTAFALGIVVTVNIFKDGSVARLANGQMLIIEGLVQGFAALCDICITVSLCWYLHSKRTGIQSTEKLVDRLIILSINRGLITTYIVLLLLLSSSSVNLLMLFIGWHKFCSLYSTWPHPASFTGFHSTKRSESYIPTLIWRFLTSGPTPRNLGK